MFLNYLLCYFGPQVFYTVMIGSFSLGQGAPNLESIAKARGAAYEVYKTIDMVQTFSLSSFFFFFVINIFFVFSHITQHSIQNITKQNNRHILNISKSSQKGGREGRTIKTQKSLL